MRSTLGNPESDNIPIFCNEHREIGCTVYLQKGEAGIVQTSKKRPSPRKTQPKATTPKMKPISKTRTRLIKSPTLKVMNNLTPSVKRVKSPQVKQPTKPKKVAVSN
jgi:hypothetical protein